MELSILLQRLKQNVLMVHLGSRLFKLPQENKTAITLSIVEEKYVDISRS